MLALLVGLAPSVHAETSEQPILDLAAAAATPTVGLQAPVEGAVSATASVDAESAPPRLLEDSQQRAPAQPKNPVHPRAADTGQQVGWTAAVLFAIALAAVLNPSLGGHALLGLFSRIDRHRLLTHPVRLRIHTAILAQPGITMKEIARSQGIGWGATVYHLGRLEHGQLVLSQRHRQFRRFYDAHAGIPPAERDARAELVHPTSQRIVALLVRSPGASQRVIADAVGISPPAAHKYLGRLEHAGLLTHQRDVKHIRYFPTPDLVARGPFPPGPDAA